MVKIKKIQKNRKNFWIFLFEKENFEIKGEFQVLTAFEKDLLNNKYISFIKGVNSEDISQNDEIIV